MGRYFMQGPFPYFVHKSDLLKYNTIHKKTAEWRIEVPNRGTKTMHRALKIPKASRNSNLVSPKCCVPVFGFVLVISFLYPKVSIQKILLAG